MKRIHTNYKAQYGITLKEAKEAARAILGRLPRCGYEICVKTEHLPLRVSDRDWDGKRSWLPAGTLKIWLVNDGGSFHLHDYVSEDRTA